MTGLFLLPLSDLQWKQKYIQELADDSFIVVCCSLPISMIQNYRLLRYMLLMFCQKLLMEF